MLEDDDEPLPAPRMEMVLAAMHRDVHKTEEDQIQMLNHPVLTREWAHSHAGVNDSQTMHNALIFSTETGAHKVLQRDDARAKWEEKTRCCRIFNLKAEATAASAWLHQQTTLEPDPITGRSHAVLMVNGKAYGGYGEYADTFAESFEAADQASATVLLKRAFFAPSQRCAKPLHTLEQRVRNSLEPADASFQLKLLQAHILRQGSLLACPSSHRDKVDAKKDGE